MTYSPAQTYSSVREDWVERELRDALGQAEFERFAVRYLAARGLTEQEARAAVGKEEQKEREGRVKLVADREASERHSRYSEKVLFAGLRTLTRDPDEEGAGVFSLDDCVELLRRCESVGATVHWIMHLSDSGDLDADVEVRKFSNARAALEKLVADGCNERFAVTFKVPSTVVDSWCEQSRSSTTEV